jgi:putative transcriptional regulator
LFKISEKVRLIAAAPDLTDPNFKHALIMVIENMHEGAFGFIVNKESDISLNEIYSESNSICATEIPAWEGGPVDETRGFLMTQQSAIIGLGLDEMADEEEVLHFSENVKVLSDTGFVKTFLNQYIDSIEMYKQNTREIVGASAQQIKKRFPFKFLMGYSGWDVDQLDEEIAEGLWIEIPFDDDLIFNIPADKAWRTALATVGLVNVESYQVPTSDWLN